MKKPPTYDERDLNKLINEIEVAGVNLKRMSGDDLALIYKICNEKDYIVWLSDHSNFTPLFVNKAGEAFYGIESGLDHGNGVEYYASISHPDHRNGLHKFIAFFNKNPKGLFRMTHYVKSADNEYKWVYTEERALSFNKAGNAKYILTIVYIIDEWLDDIRLNPRLDPIAQGFEKYKSLTIREYEILDLVSAEMSSREIAEKLNIEAATVYTHRKNLLKKLGVKSSIGLLKYALAYSKFML